MARLGGLFDHDEDDDGLFGASNFGFGLGFNPSTTKTTEPTKVAKYLYINMKFELLNNDSCSDIIN